MDNRPVVSCVFSQRERREGGGVRAENGCKTAFVGYLRGLSVEFCVEGRLIGRGGLAEEWRIGESPGPCGGLDCGPGTFWGPFLGPEAVRRVRPKSSGGGVRQGVRFAEVSRGDLGLVGT